MVSTLFRSSTLALIATLFIVAFVTDASSKRILAAHPDLPLTLTFAQFGVSAAAGWLLLLLTRGGVDRLPTRWSACAPLFYVTAAQGVGTLATNLAFGNMAVGFVHTVKASEALFTAALARIVQGTRFSCQLYLSLLPIVAGVVACALTELSFSWFGLAAAMLSNLCFAARAVLLAKQTGLQRQRVAALEQRRKELRAASPAVLVAKAPSDANDADSLSAKPGTVDDAASSLHLDPADLQVDDISNFFWVCLFSAILLLPLCAMIEGAALQTLLATSPSAARALLVRLLLTGLGQWAYTLASLLLLARSSPLVHVVMHALRRVYVVLLSTYLRDGTLRTLSPQSIVGTALVLLGALWFAREKSRQQPPMPVQALPAGKRSSNGAMSAVKKTQ